MRDEEPDLWAVNVYGQKVGAPDLAKLYAERFGRKPHHRMKPETIRAKIYADAE